MDYIVFLRNLENGKEIKLNLPMDEEELTEIVERLNPGYAHDMLIPDAWNENGENYWSYYEYGDIFEINKLLQAIEDSDVDLDIINAYVQGERGFESVEDFESQDWEDMYLHHCDSMREVAEEFLDDCYSLTLKDLPTFITNAINYDYIADYLQSVGCYYETDYGILEL